MHKHGVNCQFQRKPPPLYCEIPEAKPNGTIKYFVDPESGALQTLSMDEEDMRGFVCIRVLIDSGVSGSVLLSDECFDAPTVGNDEPKGGYAYEAAGGSPIFNEGEGDIIFVSGHFGLMGPQAAAVNKASV